MIPEMLCWWWKGICRGHGKVWRRDGNVLRDCVAPCLNIIVGSCYYCSCWTHYVSTLICSLLIRHPLTLNTVQCNVHVPWTVYLPQDTLLYSVPDCAKRYMCDDPFLSMTTASNRFIWTLIILTYWACCFEDTWCHVLIVVLTSENEMPRRLSPWFQ